MFRGIEKFVPGHFTPTPEEEKRNPNIRKKMAAANETAQKIVAAQAREKLKRSLEQMPEEESEEEERVEKIA
ncbi:hypothetical protein COS21_00480 [bacterium (Candidatus Gribaldobacteria) CG02_land_8_20_14_3_00_41_15]|uniref:Uncharacterized protein n=1 Tax=bacterium (Candidatus Gribaldobacteria) CG02_land_8_20_14_3_00_41_15 TaxID=2014270 RepID=A0A2M7DEQ7_9BACT|nr:MAG: hypothetical protein COS21_00480 [bacterium (Candidatus Gribaldobacteria) CG02_land_8_20_14_3_00_41_15]